MIWRELVANVELLLEEEPSKGAKQAKDKGLHSIAPGLWSSKKDGEAEFTTRDGDLRKLSPEEKAAEAGQRQSAKEGEPKKTKAQKAAEKPERKEGEPIPTRQLSDEELKSEVEGEFFANPYTQQIAPGAFQSPDDFIDKYKKAKEAPLDRQAYRDLGNCQGCRVMDIEDPNERYDLAKKLAAENERDLDRILRGFEEASDIPPPVIIKDKKGNTTLLGGNTRLMAAAVLDKLDQLPVKTIEYDGESKPPVPDGFDPIEEFKPPKLGSMNDFLKDAGIDFDVEKAIEAKVKEYTRETGISSEMLNDIGIPTDRLKGGFSLQHRVINPKDVSDLLNSEAVPDDVKNHVRQGIDTLVKHVAVATAMYDADTEVEQSGNDDTMIFDTAAQYKDDVIFPFAEKLAQTIKQAKQVRPEYQQMETKRTEGDRKVHEPGNLEAVSEWAKDAGYKDYIAKLTPADFDQLSNYKGDGYEDVNWCLRGWQDKEWCDEHIGPTIAAISDIVANSTITEPMSVFRGMQFSGDDTDFLDSLVEGATLEDDAFVSTSLDRDIAKRFATKLERRKGVVVQIDLEAGQPGLYIDNLEHPAREAYDEHKEAEMLLQKGSKFKIKTVNKDSDPIEIVAVME